MTVQKSGLVLSEVFPPKKGGSGKWLWEIYQRQPNNAYTMLVGNECGVTEDEAEYPQEIFRQDLSMAYRGISQFASLRSYAGQIRRVRSLARNRKARMIHAARPLSEGLVARGVKSLSGIPYLCFIHGEDVNIASTSRELRLATGWVLGGASLLVANSNFTKSLLTSDWGVADDKIRLMHPGIECSQFSFEPEANATVGGELNLLTVGRLQKRKGQDTVIRAIPELITTFPKLKYVIAGDGEEREGLVSLAAELGVSDHVRFEGEIDDARLLQLYAECDVFVLLNRAVGKDVEGFGIVLLEAQASGKPVIAGDSGGTRDTMVPGSTGLIVNGETPDELIRVLTQDLKEHANRVAMGARGREHVRTKFDWSSLASEAQQVFDSADAS